MRKIPLRLEPLQSLFLFDGNDFSLSLGAPALSGQGYPQGAEKEDFSEGWSRSLCKSIDYPAFGAAKTICLPDDLAEEEPLFSGFVRYEKNLTVTGQVPKTYLEISDAYEGVEVFVNGKSQGIQIVPTFRYDLTKALQEGVNLIRIEVATTLEREAQAFPDRFSGMIPKEPVTVPSGINGKVTLIRL